MRRGLFVLVGVALLVGCNGYNASEDCKRTRDCLTSRGGVPANSLQSCIDVSQAAYNDATDAQKKAVDDTWKRCSDLQGCDYYHCATGN